MSSSLLNAPYRHEDVDVIDATNLGALREAERKLAQFGAAVEGSADAVVVCDVDGRITHWNSAAERIYGYDRIEILGKHIGIVVSTAEQRLLERTQAAVHQGQTVALNGVTPVRKDGRFFHADITVAPVHSPSGEINGSVAITRDITEKKELESQLQQSQKMEAIGLLAGGIAHDFNNLLTIILGYGELVSTELRPEDPLQVKLTGIVEAGRRAAALTRKLLAFSRKQIARPQVLSMQQTVSELERMFNRLLGEDITVITSVDRAAYVKADPVHLEQIMMNLVVNARDAMPQGGQLRIDVSVDELPGATALCPQLAPGPYVTLRVSDTGHGMPPETLSHMFEPFFTTKGLGKGTGLGLSTVYGIVKQSGGYISVASNPGAGTAFTILLPSVPSPEAAAQRSELESSLRGTETIVLVEDEESVLRLAKETLSSYGYNVVAAANADEAFLAVERHKRGIALLITDVVMPGMNGHDLAMLIEMANPAIKVAYISGYSPDSIMQRGVFEFEDRLLEKPFTPVTLARWVRQILDNAYVTVTSET